MQSSNCYSDTTYDESTKVSLLDYILLSFDHLNQWYHPSPITYLLSTLS